MHQQTHHTNDPDSRASADHFSKTKINGAGAVQLAIGHSEATDGSDLARMANESPHTKQLRAYQQMANDRSRAMKPLQLRSATGHPALLNTAGKKSDHDTYHAFADAAGITLDVLTAAYENAELLGYTSKPAGSVPPRYNYNAVVNEAGKWTATPTQANAPDKGNVEDVVYVTAGTYETAIVYPDTNKKIKKRVSAAMSLLARQAEEEHVADFNYAYTNSLLQIHNALTAHIYNHPFGPADSEQEAKAMVNNAILANIAHAGKFGIDPIDWDFAYQALCNQTVKRDNNDWHTFSEVVSVAPADQEEEWITVDITQGAAAIGAHASAEVILFADLEDVDNEEQDDEEEDEEDEEDEESGSDTDKQ